MPQLNRPLRLPWMPKPGDYIVVTDPGYGVGPTDRFRVTRIEEKDTRLGPKTIVHCFEETAHPTNRHIRFGWRSHAFYLEHCADPRARRGVSGGGRTAALSPDGQSASARGHRRAPELPGVPPARCHHCGAATKGGMFVPGHDAKLKGDLIRQGDLAALAEQIIRGWPQHPPQAGDSDLAKKMIEKDGGEEAYLAKVVNARIAKQERREGK